MIKFTKHNIISLVFALGLFLILGYFSKGVPVFRFLAPVFVLYSLILFYYNKSYLHSIEKYNFWIAIKPVLFVSAAFGLLFFIPNLPILVLVLTTASFFLFLFEISLNKFAENLLTNEILIISFGGFYALSAADFYFPKYQTFFIALVLVFSFFLVRSFYEFTSLSKRNKTVVAMVLAMLTAEFFWALAFLPLHFSVLALILHSLFYVSLMLNYYEIFNILNSKKIKYHLYIVAVCWLVVLLSTPWKIIE